ncbi:MAG: DNA recombination protein RmuC [Alphaproteobacteria bacterium]|nr:DNA recombination protein RmuC [Alphaproteobacteria bacterium]
MDLTTLIIGVGIVIAVIGAIVAFIIGKKSANKTDNSGVSQASYRQMETDLIASKATMDAQDRQMKELQAKIESIETQIVKHQEQETIAKTKLEEAQKIEKSYQATIENMQKKSQEVFENLAHKILKENNESFDKHSKQTLAQTLDPLKANIKDFKETIDKSFQKQAQEQFSLKNEINNIVAVNKAMSVETKNLTQALKGDSKTQGNWGEFQLERLLEEAGLKKDTDYILQASGMGLRDDEDRLQKPDVVIKLPDNKHIIIDSKVSLTHYELSYNEADANIQPNHLRNFTKSIENHVKNLSDVAYSNNAKLGSPDFVIMFMPIEGAYMLAMNEKPDLHNDAWRKKVVIVSPTTLFATLKTIASIWRLERQNQNALAIAEQGGKLYDKISGFVDDMAGLGKKLNSAQESYDSAFSKLSSGRGNMVTQAEKLRALGVTPKRNLPTHLIADGESDDLITDK